MTSSQLTAIRATNAASQRNRVATMTTEQLSKHRAANAASQRDRVASMTTEQLSNHRATNLASQAQRIASMTQDQLFELRAANAAQRNRIESMSTEQTIAVRAANTRSQQLHRERQLEAIRREAIKFNLENLSTRGHERHDCGQFGGCSELLCQFCDAKHFKDERPTDSLFTSCCRKGKVMLPKPIDVINGNNLQYPEFLRKLLSDPSNPDFKHFRDNIRSYNSAVSFASMGAKVMDLPGRGPYVFIIHGQTYHRTSHLEPVNTQTPKFAQLYVLDSTQATDARQHHAANFNCRRDILDRIDRFFRAQNRLAQSYQLMRDVEAREVENAEAEGLQVPVVSMAFKRDRQSDQRRYNAPTSNEIAMIFVNEDGEPPFYRDIHVYPINPKDSSKPFINLSILSPNMDPMSYALLFPYGEPGWQPNWECDSYPGVTRNRVRNKVSMLQYKSALTSIRGEFNPIMNAGKLTQQWLVDSYLQVEANNLNYIRQNQRRLRAEQYQGLADHMANMADNRDIAADISVILPSSFEGSPRNMRERCCDAMSIFAKFGAPDLFITFTANPNWPEIASNLHLGEQTCDRPDLVARVFKIKLDSLIHDITIIGVLGKAKAYVYSIEFQKRGLPHAHILVTLHNEDKFTTVERINQFVSAEIPPQENAELREIVLKCMIHGPCGTDNPAAPCMKNGKCSKQFPKEFANETLLNNDGYPHYRRRRSEPVLLRSKMMDNRFIVPYSPFLTLKYNAHINVEIITSARFVKYIYKYTFKGYDCANVVLQAEGQSEMRHDEISNYIDCRYVSAPEAMWRLRESKMHDRSHSVIRLPVHLPNKQTIIFEEGHEEEALLAAQTGRTKLENWFNLNEKNPAARQFLYTDIPHHYTFIRGQWQERKRGGNKIVARMYTVSMKDEERFYLRILLLHVPGATSFEFLRSVDGVVYESFKAAAIARGLLESDQEWDRCLTDAATYLMPKQLREMYAYIIVFCRPSDPLKLWEDHLLNFTLDYMRHNNEHAATNLALHDLNFILLQHGLNCEAIGLPTPTGIATRDEQTYNQEEESRLADTQIKMLNEAQLAAFIKIMVAVENLHAQQKLFFVDGPGGSGKTFLYTTLLAYFRGKGQTALPFATTGIAATLLKGGRTVHSGFKLPVPILNTSVSSMRLTSPEAAMLRNAALIIIDEITMLPKNGLRCIDKLLREIMACEKSFGGKVVVLGGDFRQTLPVVVGGTRTEIIECCIKSSSLWREFQQLPLQVNMRSEGQLEHNQWILSVGEGSVPRAPGIFEEDTIQIHSAMITNNDSIASTFGDIASIPIEELASRVIIAPTNAQTLEMNRKIIDLMPGEASVYYSADSIITEDPSDHLNFPVEFLNEQTPSGMPPHVLMLKKGTIIMLLRNLNPKKGLCNGTRLTTEELAPNFIKAKIVSECNRGDVVFIPRIDLAPSETTLPFVLRRRQFPVIPAYAITINKSQGQSYSHVGILLQTAVFAHGQLYVALSRSRVSNQVNIKIEHNPQQGALLNDDRIFTRNIVYKEIL